ncbi:MAG TPA: SH3 domain-containing protein [Thermomicrobiales bacterium]|nr:SH3 domain-containing protein [Thermomicrobiales bacterium]
MAIQRVPFPPYDDRPINPYAKVGNGANYGVCERTGASFAHSMVGYLSSTDAWFRRADVASLTPWGIGGSADGALDGKIYRWMDYTKYSDVQPWSSGPWNAPGYGDGPAFVAMRGVEGINGRAEAIETSDGGNINTPMSTKQWRSFIWLSAAIAHAGGITSETYRSKLAFMQHREITTPAYKDCPFERIYNYTDEYIAAIVALMSYFEGRNDNINTLLFTIAGLTIDLRDVGRMREGGAAPVPTPKPDEPAAPAWVAGASVRAKKEILVRQAPSTSATVGMVIKGGEFAKLITGDIRTGNGMDWLDVLTVNGTGWVPKQDLELASKETTSPGPIFHAFDKPRTFTVGRGGATIRRWASRESDIIVQYVKPGTKIATAGYYFGEKVSGEDRWLVQDDDPRGRIHAGAFVESI